MTAVAREGLQGAGAVALPTGWHRRRKSPAGRVDRRQSRHGSAAMQPRNVVAPIGTAALRRNAVMTQPNGHPDTSGIRRMRLFNQSAISSRRTLENS